MKQIGQVLIIKWRDGHTSKKRCGDWSEFSDMRTRYDNDPKVRETEVQYDL